MAYFVPIRQQTFLWHETRIDMVISTYRHSRLLIWSRSVYTFQRIVSQPKKKQKRKFTRRHFFIDDLHHFVIIRLRIWLFNPHCPSTPVTSFYCISSSGILSLCVTRAYRDHLLSPPPTLFRCWNNYSRNYHITSCCRRKEDRGRRTMRSFEISRSNIVGGSEAD